MPLPSPSNRSRFRVFGALFAVGLALALSSGCASWNKWRDGIPDVRPEKARRAKETANHIREQRDHGEVQAAQFALQQGDLEGARELLDRVVKRDPDRREARLMLAELLILDQQPEEARTQLQQVLKRNPQDAAALHAMGSVLEAEGKADEALTYFKSASRLDPANREYQLSCNRNRAGEVAVGAKAESHGAAAVGDSEKPGSSRQAARNKAATADSPAKSPFAPGRSVARLVSGEDGEMPPDDAASTNKGSAKETSIAANLEPQDLVEQGGAALGAGDKEKAGELFNAARRAAPRDKKVPIAAAVLALKHDELELAAEIAEHGIRDFPDSGGLFRILGTAQYRLGRLDAAKASFEKSVSLDNSNPLSYFLLGSTLRRLGQAEAADRHFRQARQIDPRYPANL